MSLFRQSLRLLKENRVSSLMFSKVYFPCYPFSSTFPPLTLIKTLSTGPRLGNTTFERMYPTGRAVVFHLQQLSNSLKNKESDSISILNDATFKDILQDLIINLENTSVFYNYSINDLCSIYRCLLEIGIEPKHEVIDLLEGMIIDGLDNATINDFRMLIGVHNLMYRTSNGKKLFSEISYRMEQIISKMNLQQLLGMLNTINGPIPSNFLEKLEQTATSVISQITDHEPLIGLYLKFFVRLANNGRRPLPLLHALRNGLKECDLNAYPEPLHLINVVAALNKLNYPDLLLLQKIEASLTINNHLELVKINGLSVLLTAAGKMNWRCDAILNQISQIIQDESLPLRHQELVAFVLASAKLNFYPDYLDELLKKRIFPEINQKSIKDSFIWLDFVWSLVIMNLVPAASIESIFNQSFIHSLKNSGNPEAKFTKWKLMNILTYARLNGINVNHDIDLSYFQSPPRSVESVNQGAFANEILTNFIIRQKDLVTNFESPVGCAIDAEFIANKDTKFLPIIEYGTHANPLKEIPSEYKRISLIAHGFKDLVINDSSLIGPRRFTVDALNHLGTNVIVIRSSDLNTQMKPVDRVKTLRSKIAEVFLSQI
ncbi:uncharacterized protein LOC107368319 [Tetranychus urticae]|uniref:FAST kinase leucine-rich domain-containing protein n=1 Tax=Tetranychus urticae TaxID=32264 RepID=T1KY33_TETUR|nr:uncharacterized protein LOC107368319 [Tetranychus urticae]